MASVSTEEDIVNIALARIGSRPISDLDNDTTRESAAARALYYNIRDNVFRAHTWNTLTKRVQLTDSGEDPVFGWEEGYLLPSDYLRTVDVFATDSFADRIPYRLEKQTISSVETEVLLCNSSTCFLAYIYKETDPSKWTEGLQDSIAWRLAAELALALPGSRTLYESLDSKANRTLFNAKSIDGLEDYPRPFPQGSWVTNRWTGIESEDWSG